MFEYIAMSRLQAESVDDAGMTFGVIDDDVMTTADGIDGAHYPLITIIEQGGVLFFFESCQLPFQLFVIVAIATHHTGSHGGGHTVLDGCFAIHLADLRMVGQAQIVIQAPYDLFFSTKDHPAAYFPFQFWKCEL